MFSFAYTNNDAFMEFIANISPPILFLFIIVIVSMVINLIFFLKLWGATNDIAAMRDTLDDLSYWLRSDYESKKRSGNITTKDIDTAEDALEEHA